MTGPIPRLDLAEERLFPFPANVVDVGLTADGHPFGFCQPPDGQLQFFWDDRMGEPLETVISMRDGTSLFWSDDGCHLAFSATRAGRTFVVRDGVEGPSFDSVSGSVPPTFSVNGARLAYGASVGGTQRLVVDGEVIGDRPLAPIAAVFSPDGTRLAYVEQEIHEGRPQHRIVVDGVPGPHTGLRNARGVMQFSPDGRRFAHYEIDTKGSGRWVVDGVEHRWTNDVRPIGLAQLRGVAVLDPPMAARFSPDSRRFAYWADVREKGVAIVEDDHAGPLMKGTGWPFFSADGRRLAYAAERFDKSVTVIVDDVQWAGSSGIPSDPVFSPNGGRVAVTISREEGWFLRKRRVLSVVLDGDVIAEEQAIDASRWPVFSPQGDRLAWWLQRDDETWELFVDDEALPGAAPLGEPAFTSTGSLAYAGVVSGGATVFLGDRHGPTALELLSRMAQEPVERREGAPAFAISPDGEHVAWAGVFEDGARPVLDERVGPAYDQVMSWAFNPDGSATWWTMSKGMVWRVTGAP